MGNSPNRMNSGSFPPFGGGGTPPFGGSGMARPSSFGQFSGGAMGQGQTSFPGQSPVPLASGSFPGPIPFPGQGTTGGAFPGGGRPAWAGQGRPDFAGRRPAVAGGGVPMHSGPIPQPQMAPANPPGIARAVEQMQGREMPDRSRALGILQRLMQERFGG